MGVYTVHVAGESFANADGSSRQAEIRRCRVGEPVRLVREPSNRHDPDAIMVLSARGVQIGYVSTRQLHWLPHLLDTGNAVSAAIVSIGKGGAGSKGVVLSVGTSGGAPETSRQRTGWLARILGR